MTMTHFLLPLVFAVIVIIQEQLILSSPVSQGNNAFSRDKTLEWSHLIKKRSDEAQSSSKVDNREVSGITDDRQQYQEKLKSQETGADGLDNDDGVDWHFLNSHDSLSKEMQQRRRKRSLYLKRELSKKSANKQQANLVNLRQKRGTLDQQDDDFWGTETNTMPIGADENGPLVQLTVNDLSKLAHLIQEMQVLNAQDEQEQIEKERLRDFVSKKLDDENIGGGDDDDERSYQEEEILGRLMNLNRMRKMNSNNEDNYRALKELLLDQYPEVYRRLRAPNMRKRASVSIATPSSVRNNNYYGYEVSDDQGTDSNEPAPRGWIPIPNQEFDNDNGIDSDQPYYPSSYNGNIVIVDPFGVFSTEEPDASSSSSYVDGTPVIDLQSGGGADLDEGKLGIAEASRNSRLLSERELEKMIFNLARNLNAKQVASRKRRR